MRSTFRIACSLVAIAAFQLACFLAMATAADFTVSMSTLASLPPDSQEAASRQVQQQAQVAYQRLLLKVDEVDRVCGLTDAQRTKLEVAAKGAVDHALPGWLETNTAGLVSNVVEPNQQAALQRALQQRQQQVEQIQQLQRQQQQLEGRQKLVQDLLQKAGEDDRARLEAVLDQQRQLIAQRREALERQVAQLQQLNDVVILREGIPQNIAPQELRIVPGPQAVLETTVRGGRRSSQRQENVDLSASAEKEGTWNAALANMLTAEQAAELAAEARLRTAQPPQTAAQYVIAEIDQRLLLDSEQRTKLEVLVEAGLKRMSLPELNSNPSLAKAVADQVLKRIPQELLAGILSDVQIMHYRQPAESPAAPQ